MRYLQSCLLLLFILAGCRKNQDKPPVPPPLGDSVTVYIAGFENNVSGHPVIKTWINGKVNVLGDTTSSASYCSGMFISGNDVYVADNVMLAGATRYSARYFKNSEMFNLTDTLREAFCGDIFVFGSDVYVAGSERPFNTQLTTALYWKNAVSVAMTDTADANANAIFVTASNIYLGGSAQFPSGGFLDEACYWNNGTINNLNVKYSTVFSIFANGPDIYMAGQVHTTPNARALFWKNSVLTILADSTHNSGAYNVFVSGNDVYVAGEIDKRAVYWKNGAAVYLTDGTQTSSANCVYVLGTDVYVAGAEGNTAKYWKNTQPVSVTDGSFPAYADHIFVKNP